MTLSRRPSARFFAAFYRWNLYTQQRQPCLISNSGRHRCVQTPTVDRIRQYHATRSTQQHSQAQLHDENKNTNTLAHTEDTTPSSASSAIASSRQDHAAAQPEVPTETEQMPDIDEPESSPENLKNDVRTLMRKVPSSVAIVTVAHCDSDWRLNVPMGVAVSSLSTVTLDPPTISFNIKQPSQTLDAIKAADGRFRVHYLAANSGGANVVELFSKGNHPDAYKQRTHALKMFIPRSNSKSNDHNDSQAPRLRGGSVRAAMECTLTQELTVADHVILVAEIDSLKNYRSQDDTLLYFDRSFMRPDGIKVSSDIKPGTSILAQQLLGIWDYPLLLTEKERIDLMHRLKGFVTDNPKFMHQDKETLRGFRAALPLNPSSAFGINLEALQEELRKETGDKTAPPNQLKNRPVMSELYGRLSPAAMDKIIDRAQKMVANDPRFLCQRYWILLQNLGVDTTSRDLLPSDILEPLRAAGLVGPYKPRANQPRPYNRKFDVTIEYLEQVERRLVEHLANLDYKAAVSTSLEQLMEKLGESPYVANYFKSHRARLHSLAFPEKFNTTKIDISGHVTEREIRVIFRRLLHYLRSRNTGRRVYDDYNEILRLNGVHPCITGFNVEYLFARLRYSYNLTSDYKQINEMMDAMFQEFFTTETTWEDLVDRVRGFVQESPIRAMQWPYRDKLAAMGLHGDAQIVTPVSTEKLSVTQGQILDTLFSKELKNLYGTVSEELNSTIAKYLKERYNFEVEPILAENKDVKSEEAWSSSDELEAAMFKNRRVDVTKGKGNIGMRRLKVENDWGKGTS